MQRFATIVLLGITLTLPACSFLPREQAAPLPPVPPRHIVFVADGAGDYRSTSAAMRETAAANGWPIDVRTFVWSHGFFHTIADQRDRDWAIARGKDLANIVAAQKRAQPDLPVSLVGHSAGSEVVLTAAAQLPPDTLERIVLLSPSVSSSYDIRPALSVARNGMDVFYSRNDRVILGVVTAMLGTIDNPDDARAAGRFGFEPKPSPAELPLYSKLRQYEWNVSMEQVNNNGGHFGSYQPEHLQRFVLPLFQY